MKQKALSEAAIEKDLREIGVHRGFPFPRKTLARALAAAESPLEAGDLALLYREVEEGRRADNPPAALAALLEDGSWIEILEDLRKEAAAELSRRKDRNSMPRSQQTETEEAERVCGVLYCRLVYDKVPLAELAKEEQRSPEWIAEQARIGCRLRGKHPDEDLELQYALLQKPRPRRKAPPAREERPVDPLDLLG